MNEVKDHTKDIIYKIVLIGDGEVGKTSLVHRYATGEFREDYKMTIGTNFVTKEIDNTTLIIWDVSGQDHFIPVLKRYLNGADGVLYCFDLTNFESLENIDGWINLHKESNHHFNKCESLILGTKSDLLNSIEEAGSKEICDIINKFFQEDRDANIRKYVHTSSKTGHRVDEAFRLLKSYIDRSKEII